MTLKEHGKNVTSEDLHDLASRIVLNGNTRNFTSNPLSPDELHEIICFCSRQLCDGDLSEDYKNFYSQALSILEDELIKIIN